VISSRLPLPELRVGDYSCSMPSSKLTTWRNGARIWQFGVARRFLRGGVPSRRVLRGVSFEALTCLDVRPNMRGIDAPHL
jgi:hypothetical protein